MLFFIYLAQIKSNALFRIEVNIKTKFNQNKSRSFRVYFSFQLNISCLKLKKHEPPRLLLHFVPLHFAILLCIAFCVKSYYILHYKYYYFCFESYYILLYKYYYILLRKLLHFALLLHFVAKIVTFCVTIIFCVSYYNMRRNKCGLLNKRVY